MQALGEEREFVVETTQKLNMTLKEREHLLLEIVEAKAKVQYNHSYALDNRYIIPGTPVVFAT